MSVVRGIFDSVDAAERARDEMAAAGIPAGRITLSRSFTEDGVAGEAPGQSYENQPGQPQDEREGADARFAEQARSRVCVLSVSSPGKESLVEGVMRRFGASRLRRED